MEIEMNFCVQFDQIFQLKQSITPLFTTINQKEVVILEIKIISI